MHFPAALLLAIQALTTSAWVIAKRDESQHPPEACFYMTQEIDWKGKADNFCGAMDVCRKCLFLLIAKLQATLLRTDAAVADR